MKHYDLSGQRFGRLTAIKMVGKTTGGTALWECLCDCGNTHIAKSGNLRCGDTQSCGCIKRETLKKRNTVHGLRYTRLYNTWNNMKDRCLNPNNQAFQRYGGRGITVCAEWESSFQAFYDWAIANGYSDDLTLDRKENDSGYCPENCRWVTDQTQNNNKRNNKLITVNGETHTIAEWAAITGLKYSTLYSRQYRSSPNYTIEDLILNKLKEKEN